MDSSWGTLTLILGFIVGLLLLLTRPWQLLPGNSIAVAPTPTPAVVVVTATPTPLIGVGGFTTPVPTLPVQAVAGSVELRARNGSGISGTATFYEQNGRVNLTIDLDNKIPNQVFSAYVLSGDCLNPGDRIFTLTNVTSGASSTLLDTTVNQLRSRTPIIIGLYTPSATPDTPVSCGDINL